VVLNIAEMSTDDFAALDLKKTVVLIPGGVLEQHGPYLPAYTDGYQWEKSARLLAEALARRKESTVLVFPSIPLGVGGANQIGLRQVFPGTFHIHYPALRAVYLDIASELGEAGFRWIFVIDSHGAPLHRLAISQACEYFCDTYGGVMANLYDLTAPTRRPLNYQLTAEERAENAMDIHGGMQETSWMLACRPDLVRPGYKDAKPQGGKDLLALVALGTAAGWPGYFGSPRLATAARGEAYFKKVADDFLEIVTSLLDGTDLKSFARRPPIVDDNDPGNRRVKNSADEHTRAILAKQAAWLDRRGLK
jgi:creatinine amidohydrolase